MTFTAGGIQSKATRRIIPTTTSPPAAPATTSPSLRARSYCAGPGYDLATGWGSFNALQLAWAINWEDNARILSAVDHLQRPSHTQGTDNWYNTDQTVSWTIRTRNGQTPTGIAGFTQQAGTQYSFDASLTETRNDSNSFFSGPEFPNATSGCLSLDGGFVRRRSVRAATSATRSTPGAMQG